ncbi:KPN_02809 family neutral zinc metallopeptidase [Solimonas terrae]|uniref:Neutral zinc metallopeptidase n=1 Tax=Solimonas terrae TaxID=1396819 RepID=A0A6M2BR06_9GAMM|nr:neutral zinc metallopeptidase [Solimonas terrae]NGY04513.1 neutral zinc metallopeptidase [Solimonas terrae]
MKWRDARRSDNVVSGRGGGMKLGIGGIAVVVVLGLLLGKSPLEMLGLVQQIEQQAPMSQSAAPDDETTDFVRAILGETEDVWGEIFEHAGGQYVAPKLVLFSGSVQTACGGATAASGPFYCPGDRQVYLDTSFFDEMKTRLGGGGDFAYAYVIAHEVGHHVQNLTGVFDRAQRAQAQGAQMTGASGLSVRQELQADCYAGVWANRAQARHQWLEQGDIESALNTATAIGDDRLQRQAQGEVVPDSFTHGTSAQRVRWFKSGFDSGQVGACDTFAARDL